MNLGFRIGHDQRAASPSPTDQCGQFMQLILTEFLLCAMHALVCSLFLGMDASHPSIWVQWPVIQKQLESRKPAWSFMHCFFVCFYVRCHNQGHRYQTDKVPLLLLLQSLFPGAQLASFFQRKPFPYSQCAVWNLITT